MDLAIMPDKSSNLCTINGISGQFAVRNLMREAVSVFQGWQLSQDDVENLELAIAEALNNVTEHAYEFQDGFPVELSLIRRPTGVECVIGDEGKEIPDGELPKGASVELGCALCDVAEGGFGWLIIRTYADSIQYDRLNGRNKLKIHFPIV